MKNKYYNSGEPKGSRRPGRPKGTNSRKRNRDDENQLEDKTSNKRFKPNNSNIKEELTDIPTSNQHGVQRQLYLKDYNKLRGIYEEERMNYQAHLYLRRIAHDLTKKLSYLYQYPFLQYLTNACKMMMLNEFEIIAWALWLDALDLKDDESTIEEKVIYTALFVKIRLNEDSKLEEYFNWILQNLIENFNDWIEKNSSTFKPHPIEINKKYIELSRPYNPKLEQDFIEYNHLVDDILQVSPPYQSDSQYAPKHLMNDMKPGGLTENFVTFNDLAQVDEQPVLLTKKSFDTRVLMQDKEISK